MLWCFFSAWAIIPCTQALKATFSCIWISKIWWHPWPCSPVTRYLFADQRHCQLTSQITKPQEKIDCDFFIYFHRGTPQDSIPCESGPIMICFQSNLYWKHYTLSWLLNLMFIHLLSSVMIFLRLSWFLMLFPESQR